MADASLLNILLDYSLMEPISSSLPLSGGLTQLNTHQGYPTFLSNEKGSLSYPASIAFVDSSVSDPSVLMEGLEADLRVLLDPEGDGISQITEVLSRYQNLERVDLITHGGPGEMQFGTGLLSNANLPGYSKLLTEWQSHLTDDADILIFGCNVASGEAGKIFVNELSALTGADVAASTTLTGSSAKGGDWILEYATGTIQKASPLTASFLDSYDGILQTLLTSQTPSQPNSTDGIAVDWELGMQFSSDRPGQIDSIRYYKSPGEVGSHVGRIWSSTGTLLASVAFTNETASGWQQQNLASPLTIDPGASYVVSVNANSHYTKTLSGFASALSIDGLTAPIGAGVYNDAVGAFPSLVWNNTNYFRDVVFSPSLSASSNLLGSLNLTGTPTQGQILTATVADGDGLPGTINYQWQQSNNGTTWSPITGATGRTLTLQQAQVGQRIRAIASYVDLQGASEALTSPTLLVAGIPSSSVSLGTVALNQNLGSNAPNATTKVERLLTTSLNVSSGDKFTLSGKEDSGEFARFDYIRFVRADNSSSVIIEAESITNRSGFRLESIGAASGGMALSLKGGSANENGSTTFTFSGGTGLYSVILGTFDENDGVSTFSLHRNDPGVVTINGTPTQGQILTATVADGDGLPGTINYQWQQSSNGTTWSPITGGTGRTLTLQQAQLGQRVRAIASYVDLRGASEVLTSAPTVVAALTTNALGMVTISGTPTQGQILTATVADGDGLPRTINYQWQQSSNGTTWNPITGGTGRTLTLQQAQVGQRVRATASYVDLRGASEVLTSTSTSAAVLNVNDSGVVTITGTPTQGQVLTATVADADGLPATINFQWQQSNNGTTWSPITGATGRTLTLQQAQVGQRVRATAAYRDLLGSDETLPSTMSASVIQSQIVSPPATSDPSWSAGRDSSGRLIVNSGPLGTFSFQSEYRGSYPREADFTGPTPVDRVAYDWNMDGYNGQPLGSYRNGGGTYANLDLAHPAWKDGAFRNVLIKNWNIKNAYKTIPGPHVDVTQIYDSVGWGGFFAAQDSSFKNSDDGIVQWQFGYNGNSLPAYQGKAQSDFGGVVVQGVILNQEAAFIADATARVSLNGEPTVVQGNYIGSWDPGVGWFINYQTNGWPITLQQRWEKVIVVGSLPDFSFRSGDAYAFSAATSPTAGQPSAFGGRVFYYPTIEAALAAGHEEPPFVRLSTSGWANPQVNAPGARDWNPPAGW